MLKMLPRILALLGAGATTIAILTAVILEHYSLPILFMLMGFLVGPMLIAGIPTGVLGTIWWARRWNPGTRIRTAVALFLACGGMMLLPGEGHGVGGLLVYTSIPVLLLGILLLIFGLVGRVST